MYTALKVWDEMACRYPGYDDPAMARDVRTIVEWCESVGIGFEHRRVLDIGCGTGAMAIALARRGARVRGIDFSTLMLEKCRSDADRAGVASRIELECTDWKRWNRTDRYDVTLASMTPAVSNEEGFERMISCTTEAGIFVGWGAYRINAMVRALFEAHGCEYPMLQGSARRFADRLERRGLEYELLFFTSTWEERMRFEDARSYAYGQLERSGIEPDARAIDNVLRAYTVGSMVCFETEAEKGAVAWKMVTNEAETVRQSAKNRLQ